MIIGGYDIAREYPAMWIFDSADKVAIKRITLKFTASCNQILDKKSWYFAAVDVNNRGPTINPDILAIGKSNSLPNQVLLAHYLRSNGAQWYTGTVDLNDSVIYVKT